MNIEFTTRYDALGIKEPNPETMCNGDCEGTGFVPIHKDDLDEKYKELWSDAEKISKSDDGWHFIKCPDCKGSGKLWVEDR